MNIERCSRCMSLFRPVVSPTGNALCGYCLPDMVLIPVRPRAPAIICDGAEQLDPRDDGTEFGE